MSISNSRLHALSSIFNRKSLVEIAEKYWPGIKALEANPKDVDNPLTVAVELQALRKSDNPLEKSAADIMSLLGDIMGVVSEIQRNTRKETTKAWTFTASPGEGKTAWTNVPPVDIDALYAYLTKYLERFEPTPAKPPKPEKGK